MDIIELAETRFRQEILARRIPPEKFQEQMDSDRKFI